MKPKDQAPGMTDAENVFKVIEDEEKAQARKAWLEEHKLKAESKGGDKPDSKSWG